MGRDRFWTSGRWCWRLEGLVVLPAIAGPRLYQVIDRWVGQPLATLRGLGSGGGVVAVAVTASDEEALDHAFESGHALIGKGRGERGEK